MYTKLTAGFKNKYVLYTKNVLYSVGRLITITILEIQIVAHYDQMPKRMLFRIFQLVLCLSKNAGLFKIQRIN